MQLCGLSGHITALLLGDAQSKQSCILVCHPQSPMGYIICLFIYAIQEFLEHFRVLLPRTATACQEDIAALLQKMGLDNTTYQIGKTKVTEPTPANAQKH